MLILASGAITHNFGWLSRTGGEPLKQAREFSDWVGDTLARGDRAALADYRNKAPWGAEAHPTEEHFLPLFAALGAAGASEPTRRLETEYTYGGLSMDAYLWQDETPTPFNKEH